MPYFGFNPYGGRTDGRPIRPHAPWRLNTGAETANRTTVQGPSTPRTNFAEALRPRLGGLMTPQMDFRSNRTIAAAGTQPPAGGMELPEDQVAQLGQSLSVPSDIPPPAPMFAGVSDAGAPSTGGWVTTTPQQAQGIASRYSAPQTRLALGGNGTNLPY